MKLNTLQRKISLFLMIAGVIGFIASFTLTYDKIQTLSNPNYEAACSINPIISCGSVMVSEQADLFGVPASLFGIIAFTALFTFAVLLYTGSTFPRWVWLSAQAAATIGVIFAHYLFFQGIFRIGAICPWCFVVWMTVIPIFIYVTVYNIHQNFIALPESATKAKEWILANHGSILLTWYLIILGILLYKFWYYWETLI